MKFWGTDKSFLLIIIGNPFASYTGRTQTYVQVSMCLDLMWEKECRSKLMQISDGWILWLY